MEQAHRPACRRPPPASVRSACILTGNWAALTSQPDLVPAGRGTRYGVLCSTELSACHARACPVAGNFRVDCRQGLLGRRTPGTEGRIAFAMYVPSLGHERIFTIKPDGTAWTQLTFPKRAHNFNPAWSADGSQLVFERESPRGQPHIFAINADGTDEHRVMPFPFRGLAPFFSPDGSTIVFAHTDDRVLHSGIWVVNADGTNLRSVVIDLHRWAELRWSQFSPDGSKITFTKYVRSGESAIFTVNLDGSSLLRLTDWDLGAAAAS